MMRLMVEHLYGPEPARDGAWATVSMVGIGRRRCEPVNGGGARPLQYCHVHFFSALAQLIEVFIEVANVEKGRGAVREVRQQHHVDRQEVIERAMNRTKKG